MTYVKKDAASDAGLVPEIILPGEWSTSVTYEGTDVAVNIKGKKKHLIFSKNMYREDGDTDEQAAELGKLRTRTLSRIRFGALRDHYKGKISEQSAEILEEIRIAALERRVFKDETLKVNLPILLQRQSGIRYPATESALADSVFASCLGNPSTSALFYLLLDPKYQGDISSLDSDGFSGGYHPWHIRDARIEALAWLADNKVVLDSIYERLQKDPTQKTVVKVGKELDELLGTQPNGKGSENKGEDGDSNEGNKKPNKPLPPTPSLITKFIRSERESVVEGYAPGKYKTKWAKVEWVKPELTVNCKPPETQKTKQLKRKVSDMGNAPNRMERMLIDQRIFSPKGRKKTPAPVTLVVDCSGSMNPDYQAIGELIGKAPNTQVVFYSGHGTRGGETPGRVFIAAKDGKRIEESKAASLFATYGNNDMDLPVLQWAAAQPGKVVWISDGRSYCLPNGRYDNGDLGITECQEFIVHHNIPRYNGIWRYIEAEEAAKGK